MKRIKTKTPDVFDSELPIVKPIVIVPAKINWLVKALQEKLWQNEFSILLKGSWKENGFLLDEDYYVPEQEVGSASVDYKEDLSTLQREWNVIYHSHPFSVEPDFSSADRDSINAHFPCSLLGNGEGIKRALLSFFTDGVVIQVDAKILLQEPTIQISEKELSKIKTAKSGYYTNSWSEWERNWLEWLKRRGK